MDSFTTIVASVCDATIKPRGPIRAETAPIINENATRSATQPIGNVHRPITKRDFTFVAKESDDNLVKSTLTLAEVPVHCLQGPVRSRQTSKNKSRLKKYIYI